MISNFRTRVYEIIEKGQGEDKQSIIFDKFIMTLIIVNVIAIILESFQTLKESYNLIFRSIEIISVIIFTVEYFLRMYTADLKYEDDSKPVAIIKYIISPMAIIDLLAIIPTYLPMIFPFDLRFIRMLRLTRLLRVFKLNRYYSSLNVLGKVLKKQKEQLVMTISITFLMLLVASTLMYYIEHDVQPEAFPNIIASFWWAIATLTTVGYGDVYPITGWGRFLSGIIALLGIGIVALPTGILSSGFMEELENKNKKNDNNDTQEDIKYCPYCGKKLKNK